MKEIQRVVVGGVVLKDNKALILKRHENEKILPGMWELPSGKLEFNEKPHEGIIREVKEETGIDAEVILPFDVFDYMVEKEDSKRHSVQINFLLKMTSETVKISDEHQDYAWVSKEELDNFKISEKTKNTLLKAFERFQ
jgi:8-oxo-dGTP diphosphatase